MPTLTPALMTIGADGTAIKRPPAPRAAGPLRLANWSWPGLLVASLTLWSAALALGRTLLRASGATGPLVDSLAQAYAPTMRVLLTLDAAAGLLLAVSLGSIAVHVGQAAARSLR